MYISLCMYIAGLCMYMWGLSDIPSAKIGSTAALLRILSRAVARLISLSVAGILNLSNNNDLNVVRSAGLFQLKTQTQPDSQSGPVPSQHWWLLHAPFAHLPRKFMLQQCSQGANAIPPNGIPSREALSSTSPLVLLLQINKNSGVLIDVVRSQKP